MREVYWEECGLKYVGKRTWKDNKDNKGRQTICSFWTRQLNNPDVLSGWMTARMDWRVCGNALMHGRLYKFFSGSG